MYRMGKKSILMLMIIVCLAVLGAAIFLIIWTGWGKTTVTDNLANGTTDQTEVTDGLSTQPSSAQPEVVMFHNDTGPMCIEAKEFFEENGIQFEEHLTTDSDFSELLFEYKAKFNGQSEGESSSFGYYPMIFLENKAFSGYNDSVGEQILKELGL